ncbi:MAG: transposase [Desulfomicrobium sp.]|jgi:putative transposase|nr:transposase [Desulfomicrobium sp.]NLV96421.1 transposase [Desulfovibrionales bacterium]
MKRPRFSKNLIVRILNEAGGEHKVAKICREYGISQDIYRHWKSKYDDMEISGHSQT